MSTLQLIKDSPELSLNIGHRQRLKDKLLRSNIGSLADYEILEILLFYSIPRKDVKPLAKHLLHKYNNLGSIISLTDRELREQKITESTIVLLKLLKDLISRINKEQLLDKPIINSWHLLVDYVRANIGYKKTECLNVMYLNHKNILIAEETEEHGTVNSVSVYPREILKKAILYNASSIVLVHNHPSGITEPSKSDIILTKQLVSTLEPLNISLIDHIIISSNSYYSFKKHGII
jgi:DNA repair protein RadC